MLDLIYKVNDIVNYSNFLIAWVFASIIYFISNLTQIKTIIAIHANKLEEYSIYMSSIASSD